MNNFRSVAAATDFSVDGNNAVRRAAQIARQHGARLTIVHVLDETAFQPLRGWFAQSVDSAARLSQAKLSAQRLAKEVRDPNGTIDTNPIVNVLTGKTIPSLLRAAEQADLFVVGQRARNLLHDLLRGHTAHRLAERARQPVLVVKQAVTSPYRRVLVPFDFTPNSDAAAVVAAATMPGVDLQLFHAFKPGRDSFLRRANVAKNVIRETQALERESLMARMRRRAEQLGFTSRKMGFAVGHGPFDLTILKQEQHRRVDLMVVGKQRRSKLSRWLVGSVSNSLLINSRCDMLIVPHQEIEAMPAAGQACVGD